MATLDTGRRVEKRNRPPVSCEPCRGRKLKCNRGSPCDTCTRRGLSSLCNYAANASRGRPASSRPRDLKDRLNGLERLVSSFLSGDTVIQPGLPRSRPATGDGQSSARGGIGSKQDAAFTGTDGEDSLTPETPHLQETVDGQVNYIDPGHWLSILDDIKEVREHLSIPSQPTPPSDTGLGADRGPDAGFLLGSSGNPSLDEILSSLPSQATCDMLLSWYFNSRFMVLAIIHPTKFQDEYAALRESPSTTPPLWIALLFSVLSVAAALRQASNPTGPEGPDIRTLQQRTLQCLTLGHFTSANAHALEAYILHLQSRFLTDRTLTVDMWFETGTIIRLALRMGYHRDPDTLRGVSPFDGEMRRRVWLNVFQVDALMSFQLGFPSMIPVDFCDARAPRNLQDSDLRVDAAVLPPPRPLDEHTPVLYTIVKAGVMGVFKKITAHTQALTVPPYERTLVLDAEMNRAYAAVPERLKSRDVGASFIDHPCLIWERASLEMLRLKGLIVLHRRHVSYERQSPRFEPSRRACVEAALGILARQADLHRACEPGGRLFEDRWMFAALPVHDFLLAAVVVCLDLSVRMRAAPVGDEQRLEAREYLALQASQRIWAAGGVASPEAQTAALVLDLMIGKVAEKDTGLFLAGDASSGGAEPVVGAELPYAGAVSQMIDGSEGVDWGLLDQYFQNMDTAVPDAAA